MSETLIIPCQIGGFRTLKDGSVKLDIETWELKAPDFATLGELRNRSGYLAFQEAQFGPEFSFDIPDISPEFKTDKSPSQRLRNTLFVYWQKTAQTEEFEVFYRRKVDGIIKSIKDRIPE